ncbi:YciI family protein [Anthocerotibacter panamensis]|uniref:YciI family protein n=1 Tax=Anthocerotibacter panamensis TaxID=2857077 RepID=UPI001C404D98|nr:YciI family protein [Anthocerotibacter panamensis]
MARYVLFGSYSADVVERRAPHREAHLTRLRQLQAQGKVITIGPTKDLTKVFGVYEAADEAAARTLVEEDPYWQAGVWTEYTLMEWIQAF